MSLTLSEIKIKLSSKTHTWLVSGAAGFIGSHLVENLLMANQNVIGIDDLSNGSLKNLDEIRLNVGEKNWNHFQFFKIDIRSVDQIKDSFSNIDYILHQAALGSVPRSIDNPMATHEANVTGTLQMLILARDCNVKKFVFASSSSVYGDCLEIPQKENTIGTPMSPYAVSKRSAELYSLIFSKTYNLPVVGLRYFNVFGPRQRPDGPYAAVIPRWTLALNSGEIPTIFGDGSNSRDFCYVENVVKANLLAALNTNEEANNQIYNITMGGSTSLNELYSLISKNLQPLTNRTVPKPVYMSPRQGDLGRSQADISKAQKFLDYTPEVSVHEGLRRTVAWYTTPVLNSPETSAGNS